MLYDQRPIQVQDSHSYAHLHRDLPVPVALQIIKDKHSLGCPFTGLDASARGEVTLPNLAGIMTKPRMLDSIRLPTMTQQPPRLPIYTPTVSVEASSPPPSTLATSQSQRHELANTMN